MNVQEYIKEKQFNPFASDENIGRVLKEQSDDRNLVKGPMMAKNKPSAFNQMITCNWIDPDLFWGWRVKMDGDKPSGFVTLLTVKEFHSMQSDERTIMGGPALGAVADETCGINTLFAMRRFCPIIKIEHYFQKQIKVGHTLITENIYLEKWKDGLYNAEGIQKCLETGEQIGTYYAVCKDLKYKE